MWVILPGWACPPTDYEELIADEPYVVLDQWETPLTEPLDIIRREVARLIAEEHDAPEMPTKVKLFGHSFGGLIAVEWAWKHPEEVEQLVLADPSEPEPIGDRLPPLRMTKLMVKGTAVAGPWLYRVSRKLFGTRQDQWGVRERFAGRKNAQFLVDEFSLWNASSTILHVSRCGSIRRCPLRTWCLRGQHGSGTCRPVSGSF